MPKHKTTRPRPKRLYRLSNWPEYERALRHRSSITFWLSPEGVETWRYRGEKQRGSQFVYSDQAIQMMLTIKEVFHLSNRGAEGFLRSLFGLLGLALAVPDHTTLSKRSRHLAVSLPRRITGPLQVVLDSTGLKLYGEGEWKVRQHGHAKHRTWRTLHLGIEPESGEIQAVVLTTNAVSDSQAVPALLAQIEAPLLSCTGDGGYDKRPVYQALQAHSPAAQVVIPPRRNAHIWQHGNSQAERLKRDENLRSIRRQGRRAWMRATGYHRRSLAETCMFRLRTVFSDRLSARRLDTQKTQVLIRCRALNLMTHLTMPQSYRVAT